jgi:hypothetical protein
MLVTSPISAKSGANFNGIFVIAPRCACLFRTRSWLNFQLDTE